MGDATPKHGQDGWLQLKMEPIWSNVDVESDTDIAGLSNVKGIESDCPGSSHLMANHCLVCKILNDAALQNTLGHGMVCFPRNLDVEDFVLFRSSTVVFSFFKQLLFRYFFFSNLALQFPTFNWKTLQLLLFYMTPAIKKKFKSISWDRNWIVCIFMFFFSVSCWVSYSFV